MWVADNQWIADGRSSDLLPIKAAMEAYITTYCRNVCQDVDNVLKWTLDGLNAKERPRSFSNNKQAKIADTYKFIYDDDKQIYKLTSERIEADTWTQLASEDVSTLVYEAIDKYSQPNRLGEFMHIMLVWEESED